MPCCPELNLWGVNGLSIPANMKVEHLNEADAHRIAAAPALLAALELLRDCDGSGCFCSAPYQGASCLHSAGCVAACAAIAKATALEPAV